MAECPKCGGFHFEQSGCPFPHPCSICGNGTDLACSDCAINSGGEKVVYVCLNPKCRDLHEAYIHKDCQP